MLNQQRIHRAPQRTPAKRSALDPTGRGESTWQVYQDTQLEALLRQGFSIGVDLDEGHTVAKGEQITLTDTSFTIRLPALQPGEQTRLWVDLFCWESDGDTAKVLFAAPDGSSLRAAPRTILREARRMCSCFTT
jgi:hypothetical protein